MLPSGSLRVAPERVGTDVVEAVHEAVGVCLVEVDAVIADREAGGIVEGATGLPKSKSQVPISTPAPNASKPRKPNSDGSVMVTR